MVVTHEIEFVLPGGGVRIVYRDRDALAVQSNGGFILHHGMVRLAALHAKVFQFDGIGQGIDAPFLVVGRPRFLSAHGDAAQVFHVRAAHQSRPQRQPQSGVRGDECKAPLPSGAAQAMNDDYRELHKQQGKQTYKGLTFQAMTDYIKTQANSEAEIRKYEVVRHIAKIKGSEYALTKKWFLNAYPAYKEKAIVEQEMAEMLQAEKTPISALPTAAGL